MNKFDKFCIFNIILWICAISYFPIKEAIEWPNKEITEAQYYNLYILNKKYPKIFDAKIKFYEDKKITNAEFKKLKQLTLDKTR